MANFDVLAWESLSLVQRLIQKDEGAWYDIKCVIKEISPLLSWRPEGLEEYTDHDLNHCYRIAQALGNIIPSDFCLNKYELQILLYSIVLHDLGMWTKKCETEIALQNDEFVDFYKKNCNSEKINNLIYSSIKEEKYAGMLYLRQIVAQYNRMNHAQRTRYILENANTDSIIPSRISREYLQLIGVICAAHDWETDEVLTNELLDEYRIQANDFAEENDHDLIVDVRLLAFLLRVGDLLDLDSRRISRIVWRYMDKLSPASEAHWRKHECLRFKKLNKDEIVIAGNFNYDRYGQVATEAYHLAKQWCEYLKSEVSTLKKAMRTPVKYAMTSGRQLGELFIDTSEVKGTGIIFANNLSFNMDKSRIIEILGDEIYEDKSSFIRELIQNAIDATRTQIVEDYQSGKLNCYSGLDIRSPNSWPREITTRPEYAIHISTGTSIRTIKNTDKSLMYFEVSDFGIGMTVDQIKNYFLQIGRSYYKSADFKLKYQHSSISRFGIGFLSCLLAGDYIEVETKSRDSDVGLKLTMDNSTDIVAIVSQEKDSYGTTVRVWFDSNVIEGKGWLPVDQIDEDLAQYSHPDLSNSNKLLQAIYYWVPWSEITIFVNNQKVFPKTPSELKSNARYWAIPYSVIAIEDNEKLADGSIIIEKKTAVPRFNDRDNLNEHFMPSIGGVSIPPWKKAIEAVSYIDIYRQPESIITASRRAKFEIPSNKVKNQIVKQVIRNIDEHLTKTGDFKAKLYQALFRASICIEVEGLDLLLPVIRERKLQWENWDQKRFDMETCVMVPFFAPIEYQDLQYKIPVVGVPRRKRNSPRKILPKIENVRAVNLNGKFTAALSLANGWFDDNEIDCDYTYLMYRFVKYNKQKESWEIVSDQIAAQESIRNQMASWDRTHGNPWKQFGFDPYVSSCWSYATAHFGLFEDKNIGKSVVNVKVPRREWNILEKQREYDPFLDLFLNTIINDE